MKALKIRRCSLPSIGQEPASWVACAAGLALKIATNEEVVSVCRTCRTSGPAQVRQVGHCLCRTTTPLGVWGGARQGENELSRYGKIIRL